MWTEIDLNESEMDLNQCVSVTINKIDNITCVIKLIFGSHVLIIMKREAIGSFFFLYNKQGSVVRRPDSAIQWIAIFFNLRKIGH